MVAAAMTRSIVATPVFAALPARQRLQKVQARRAPAPCRARDPAAPDTAEVPADVIEFAKTLPGVSQPFPNIFDPLNFLGSAAGTKSKINEVKRWREAEVTHGRVSMLASLGFITQEQLIGSTARPFPHVEGPAIGHFQQVEAQGGIFWIPLLLVIAIAEAYRASYGWAPPNSANFYQLREDYAPGEIGFDPLGLCPTDPKEKYDLQTKELNNGRLAMIAIAAFVAQELNVQQPIFANLNLTGLPK